MAEPTENQPQPTSGEEPAPTRPTWKMAAVVVIAILAFEGISHWPQISEFAHLPQIEHTLGIG